MTKSEHEKTEGHIPLGWEIIATRESAREAQKYCNEWPKITCYCKRKKTFIIYAAACWPTIPITNKKHEK